ncbi:MAG TPA: hypothetical protein VF653_12290 [Methylomirabilota bacterium]
MSSATALRRGELSAGRLAALMNAPSILCLALVLNLALQPRHSRAVGSRSPWPWRRGP